MFKNIICLPAIVMCLYCFSVNAQAVSSVQKESALQREFNVFFKKFETDKGFQFSHIIFPVKVMDLAGDIATMRTIAKAQWKFTNLFADKKQIIKKSQTGANQFTVSITVQETGIHVTHVFQKKNGKWQLVLVKDESA